MQRSTSELFKEHVDTLLALAESDDLMARKSLACLSLLAEGWRYGDPDPVDPPDGGGGSDGEECDNVIHFGTGNAFMKRAA